MQNGSLIAIFTLDENVKLQAIVIIVYWKIVVDAGIFVLQESKHIFYYFKTIKLAQIRHFLLGRTLHRSKS